ncbi:MAG: Asp23/Gls24 family envelope stress response protein [Clostridia bacterium]|nr:Asp23/Gls24 family envelope stress response protein [Clostridia bacterium]
MAVNTHNAYGQISITDETIAIVAGHAARECYGIVEMVSRRLTDSLAELFQKDSQSRGVKVSTSEDRIFIDLFVIIKFGVSIKAVCDSLKEAVKYHVENFTGMIVDTVNVNVIGIKL